MKTLAVSAASLLALTACRQDMHDGQKVEPLEASSVFADGRGSRDPLDGTIARGQLKLDTHLHAGKVSPPAPEPVAVSSAAASASAAPVAPPPPVSAALVTADVFPFPVTESVLNRGEQRFNVFCAPCHSRLGDGNGMIVQRGYKAPSSFHVDRLRSEKPGYFFDAISNGFGVMPSYAAQIPVNDRWSIVAYIRALQLSQNASVSDVPPDHRKDLAATDGGAK